MDQRSSRICSILLQDLMKRGVRLYTGGHALARKCCKITNSWKNDLGPPSTRSQGRLISVLGADLDQFWVVVWPQGLHINIANLMVSFFHPGHEYKAMKFSIY